MKREEKFRIKQQNTYKMPRRDRAGGEPSKLMDKFGNKRRKPTQKLKRSVSP